MITPGLLLLVGLASAQDQPPPIVNGTTTDNFEAVGVLAAVDLDAGVGSPFCTATLIADEAVVTAGHCAEAALVYQADYDIAWLVGESLSSAEQLVLVEGWEIHPDYTFAGNEVAADVAVGLLERSPTGVTPMPVLGSTPGGGWYTQDLQLVGYGITGDNRQDAGTKRTASLPVYTIDSDFVYALDESDPDSPNACSGDSGGAALIQGDSGVVLAGVISFVFPWHDATACIGGGVGSARMDVFGDWVEGEVDDGFATDDSTGSAQGQSSGSGAFDAGRNEGCATAPTGGGMLLGLIALLGRRRRDRG